MGDHASSAARGTLPILSTMNRILGTGYGQQFGALGLINGGYGAGTSGMDMYENGVDAGNSFDMFRSLSGIVSGLASVSGAAGTAMGAGSGGVGAAAGASLLGTAGCVLGAGLAGYGVGNLLAPVVYGSEEGTSTYTPPEGGTYIDDPATTGNDFVDWVFGV